MTTQVTTEAALRELAGPPLPRLVRDAPYLDRIEVRGLRPLLALEVEQVFFHCSEAFLHAQPWSPETWERYYGPRYAEGLY
jgi:uncharacterized protein